MMKLSGQCRPDSALKYPTMVCPCSMSLGVLRLTVTLEI